MPATSNAEEAEVEWFYEDLQDLLELTPKKDVLSRHHPWSMARGHSPTSVLSADGPLGSRGA